MIANRRDMTQSALAARASGKWSRQKLMLLEAYVRGFTVACKRADGGCFIDGFAGPGWNQDVHSGGLFAGSPQIAAASAFSAVYLIDTELEHIAALKSLSLGTHVRILQGDANAIVPGIVGDLQPWLPVLIFMDQTANQLEFETLRQIARANPRRKRKPELLILLPTGMVLARLFPCKGGVQHDRVLDRVFGTSQAWRQVVTATPPLRGPKLIEALARTYENLLTTELGYVEPPIHRHILSHGERGRTLYTLVFATDHQVGTTIMSSCLKKRLSGQQSLL